MTLTSFKELLQKHIFTHRIRVILLMMLVLLTLSRVLQPGLVAAATFGTTTIGTTNDTSNRNNMTCNRYQSADSGSLTSISVYVNNIDTSSRSYSLAIYRDSSGNPGTLLSSSANGTLNANTWNSLSVSGTVTAGNFYWLCYNTSTANTSLNNMKFSGGAATAVQKIQSFGTWPSSFGTPGATWTANYSIYATVTVPATPTPTPRPTSTPTPIPTVTPTPIPTSTPTPTPTPVPTSTPLPTPTPNTPGGGNPNDEPTPTPTLIPTATPTPTPLPRHKITGTAYNDANQSGTYNAGESLLPGITVSLSGDSTATTTTDSLGNYTFVNLLPGTYTVTFTLPANSKATTPLTDTVTLPNDAVVRFGMIKIFTLSGRAFTDFNTNGNIDSGDTARQGVTVKLSGGATLTTTTNTSGNFSFPNLQGGLPYTISVDTPSGYMSTTANSVNLNLNSNQTFLFGFAQSSSNIVPGVCSGNSANIAMVIDHSGSMNDPDPLTGRPKIEEARDAAIAFVQVVQKNLPTAQITLVLFAGSDGFPNNRDESSVLVPMTNNFNQVISALEDLEANGGKTCFDCGIYLANQELERSVRPNTDNFMIFLTDGIANATRKNPGVDVTEDEAENNAMEDLIEGTKKHKGKTDTIGVGKGKGKGKVKGISTGPAVKGISTGPGSKAVLQSTTGPDIDEEFLQSLANVNNGIYLNNPDYNTLDEIYLLIASLSISTGVVNGMVFNDKNANGIFEPPIETRLPNFTIQASSPSLTVGPIRRTTDSNGNYSFTGLCTGRYDITQVLSSPWLATTQTSYTIGVISGNTYNNINFGNRYGYSIVGSVFDDVNKNRIKNTGEGNIAGARVTATAGNIINNPDGSYRIEGLLEGTYLVSYTSLMPSGYFLVHPKNGPPPSFSVNVGANCSADASAGAQCINGGDVIDLNFSISNSIPWYQTYNGNVRIDNGITSIIPVAPSSPRFFAITNSAAQNPGVVIIGDSTANFGNGSASSTNALVGGTLYPEVYPQSSNTMLATAYETVLNKAQRAGVPIIDLSTVAGCASPSNCTLPNTLPEGVYLSRTDLTLNNTAFSLNRDYIFLVNGTLTLRGTVQTSVGSTAFFSAQRDIVVERNVAAAVDSYPVPPAQLQGQFVAGRNFMIQGLNDCVVGQDYMLNVAGSVVVNASRTGGRVMNSRDLCGDNPRFPSFTVQPRLDFIINAPELLMQQRLMSHEVSP